MPLLWWNMICCQWLSLTANKVKMSSLGTKPKRLILRFGAWTRQSIGEYKTQMFQMQLESKLAQLLTRKQEQVEWVTIAFETWTSFQTSQLPTQLHLASPLCWNSCFQSQACLQPEGWSGVDWLSCFPSTFKRREIQWKYHTP